MHQEFGNLRHNTYRTCERVRTYSNHRHLHRSLRTEIYRFARDQCSHHSRIQAHISVSGGKRNDQKHEVRKCQQLVGQKVYSKKNGSVCSIIKEIELNNIKHFELSIENDVYKREVILSEHALKLNYKK